MSIYRTHIISRGVRIFFATVFLAFYKSVLLRLRTSPIRWISSVIMLLETVNFDRDGLNVTTTTGRRFWENGVFWCPYLIIEIGRSDNYKGRQYSVLKYGCMREECEKENRTR